MSLRPLLLAGDAAAVCARRVLQKLIEQEQRLAATAVPAGESVT